MTFTATGASATISFLATSSNVYVGLDAVDVSAIGGGVPPVSAIPEPETYALMLAGLGVVGWTVRRRRSA